MSNSRLLKVSLWPAAAIVLSGICFEAQAWAQTEGRPSPQTEGQPSTSKGDWPSYFADSRGTRYSPQDQINASNFNQLEVAWHFKTDNLGLGRNTSSRERRWRSMAWCTPRQDRGAM